MTYKEYLKALKHIDACQKNEFERLQDEMKKVQQLKEKRKISEKEAFERDHRLAEILDKAKNRYAFKTERLKMNFARQNIEVKTGDIIWAQIKGTTRVIRVEEIRLAAFEYPMLKLFGTQLTLYGQPCKHQLFHPKGGIYQKDITSINGEPYTYSAKLKD